MSSVFSQLKSKFAAVPSIKQHKLLASKDKNFKINVVLSIAVLSTGVFYLAQVNGLSTKGYRIRELERSVATLQTENKKLEVAVVEARSMATLDKKIGQFALVDSDKIEYFNSDNVAMAH